MRELTTLQQQILAMNQEGHRNNKICEDLTLSRGHVGGVISRLKQWGYPVQVFEGAALRPQARKPSYNIKEQNKRRVAEGLDRLALLPTPVVPTVIEGTLDVPLARRKGCAFPTRHDGDSWLFCDQPRNGTREYCEHHLKIMYRSAA